MPYTATVNCDRCGNLFEDERTVFVEAGLVVPVSPTAYPHGLTWFARNHSRLNTEHRTKVVVRQVQGEKVDA